MNDPYQTFLEDLGDSFRETLTQPDEDGRERVLRVENPAECACGETSSLDHTFPVPDEGVTTAREMQKILSWLIDDYQYPHKRIVLYLRYKKRLGPEENGKIKQTTFQPSREPKSAPPPNPPAPAPAPAAAPMPQLVQTWALDLQTGQQRLMWVEAPQVVPQTVPQGVPQAVPQGAQQVAQGVQVPGAQGVQGVPQGVQGQGVQGGMVPQAPMQGGVVPPPMPPVPYWFQPQAPPAPRGFFETMGARMGERLADQPVLVDTWLAVVMKNIGELVGMLGNKPPQHAQQPAAQPAISQPQPQMSNDAMAQQVMQIVRQEFNNQALVLQEAVQQMVREEVEKLK
jgi:hypothetical protein